VPRALDRAPALVEHTLNERPVVMRAPVLDRKHSPGAVEHSNLEIVPFDQTHLAGREIDHGADFDDFGQEF
jgi:hypothetical protein